MSTGPLLAALAVMLLCITPGDPRADTAASGSSATDKIRFDLSLLNDDGLYGPPDGLRALHYEFCIPAAEPYVEQVQAIDLTVEVMRGPRGRIGCTPEQYLCVGSTHQPGFRDVLTRLAELPFIERIEQAYFE
jgi:hypothetical protein